MFGIRIDGLYWAGTGAGPYRFATAAQARAFMAAHWTQLGERWKRRHLKIVGEA